MLHEVNEEQNLTKSQIHVISAGRDPILQIYENRIISFLIISALKTTGTPLQTDKSNCN